MRIKIVILLLLLAGFVFGQVPDTENFTLQDVVDEVNPTTDDLQDCFNDAISAYFDPTYTSYPANSLLRFRNYGPSSGAAPSYVTETPETTSSGTSIDATYPATVSPNDIMFITLAVENGATVTPPSGWSYLISRAFASSHNAYVYWKRTDGSEDGSSVTFNFSTTTNAVLTMTQFSGVGTGVTPTANSSGGSSGLTGFSQDISGTDTDLGWCIAVPDCSCGMSKHASASASVVQEYSEALGFFSIGLQTNTYTSTTTVTFATEWGTGAQYVYFYGVLTN